MRAAGVWAISIAGAVVVAAAAGWAIATAGIGATTTPTASPPSLVASGAPSPTSSTPTDAPAAVVPADCNALYGDATKAALADAGRTLNPAWLAAEAHKRYPSTNDAIAANLASLSPLICDWENDTGASEAFVLTAVAHVTADERQGVLMQLHALDFTCEASDGGQLCFHQLDDAGRAAEEHFLRDGIWVATTRSEVDPPAYTADIIAHIFN